ncbi:hypothetical protein [Pseudonocardia sp. N23]|uniref:hypothetical protein n=1 Tax=Pseudonocardia sp. N23 TaxID=1987376 RepID=UPI000C032344|nr:hypothetical protein [Pseudonocardia sp. N23]GAY07442.1 possible transcriptional regulator, ArsR family [Pseudonocardia sp. N23]
MQRDVAALDRTGLDGTATGLPSVGVSGETRVAPDRRQAFLADLGTTPQELFTRYGGPEGDAFRLTVACYPFTNAEGADHARPDHPAR